MSYTIVFLTNALTEYVDASKWYEEQLEGLGERFENAVGSKLDQIIKNPLIYPSKRPPFRQVQIMKFPFHIVYKVNRLKMTITICAIYHTSRNPQKKYRD